MFNIAGFHIPKQIAFKHGQVILDKLGWQHPGLKPLGEEIELRWTSTVLCRQWWFIYQGHDKRLYTKLLNEEDVEKQEDYSDCDREEYLGINISPWNWYCSFLYLISLESILEDLTPYDVRQLVMMEDEMAEIKASIF